MWVELWGRSYGAGVMGWSYGGKGKGEEDEK